MEKSFQAVVIGAGPGGYVCAIKLAQLGIQTAIIERDQLGGVCLNVGCIPSKALIQASSVYESIQHSSRFGFMNTDKVKIDFKKLQEWKTGVVSKLTSGVGQLLKGNKVTVVKGEATFLSPTELEVRSQSGVETITAQHFIIATGSSPIELPPFPFDEQNILSSTGGLLVDAPIQSLLVVGGGYIGLEIGTYLAKLGTEVTIVEAEDRLLSTYDEDVANVVIKNIKKQGVKVITSALAKSVKKKKNQQEVSLEIDGEIHTLSVEKILVTVGRKPNPMAGIENTGVKTENGFIPVDSQLRTNIPNIYAIGDVAGQPMLAHKASKEAQVVAEVIAQKPGALYDVRAMPAVIFCDPEIATVGMNEREAKRAGIETMVGVFPFAALGKSIATQETTGFAKIIGNKATGQMIGAAIVGHNASALIGECALGLEAGLQVEDFALTVHAHPTLSEAIMEAAEVALDHPLHIMPKRSKKT